MDKFQEALTHISVPGFRIKHLLIDDLDNILALLKQCPDYFVMESGHPASDSDARAILMDLPCGKTLDDKTVLGLETNGRLTAVLEVLKDYPEPGTAWIGLLLIHPNFRGRGLGREIVSSLSAALQPAGVREIRLGVLDENISGLDFWQKLGFRQIAVKPNRQFGSKTHKVIVLALTL